MRRPGRLLLPWLALLASCNRPEREQTWASPPGQPAHPESVRKPAALTSIAAQLLRGDAQPLRVPCATCHSISAPRELPASTADLRLFHVGLELRHGDLACGACHAAGNPPRLHLATGAEVPLAEAMVLCGQCHGTQLRDYRHGAHGGMTGYWDRSRGPRSRNHCVACHDAHAPAYVGGRPVFAPRDTGSRERDRS